MVYINKNFPPLDPLGPHLLEKVNFLLVFLIKSFILFIRGHKNFFLHEITLILLILSLNFFAIFLSLNKPFSLSFHSSDPSDILLVSSQINLHIWLAHPHVKNDL